MLQKNVMVTPFGVLGFGGMFFFWGGVWYVVVVGFEFYS